MDRPLVSVCILTYQHSAYIRACLDSVLMQQTTFPFEVVIGEDGSTDGTREICLQYAAAHPGKVRVILRERKDVIYINGKPTGRFNFAETLKACRGRYIAFLEGDDYWTDPLKLQKQADVLEARPDIVCCHHWQKVATPAADGTYEERTAPKEGQGYLAQETTTVREVFANRQRLKSRTWMFRNIFGNGYTFPDWFYKTQFGDVPLCMILGKAGNFFFIDEEMAVYRMSGKGLSTRGNEHWLFTFHHYTAWVRIWEYSDLYHRRKHHAEALATIFYFYDVIFRKYNYSFTVFRKMAGDAFNRSAFPFFLRLRVGMRLTGTFIGARIKRIFQ